MKPGASYPRNKSAQTYLCTSVGTFPSQSARCDGRGCAQCVQLLVRPPSPLCGLWFVLVVVGVRGVYIGITPRHTGRE